jgi:uroporphyrinogen-III synthase
LLSIYGYPYYSDNLSYKKLRVLNTLKKNVLSLKKLTDAQRWRILVSGASLIDFNIIRSSPFIDKRSIPENKYPYIITSSAAFLHPQVVNLHGSIFCVGTKTAEKARNLQIEVTHSSNYSQELGKYINSRYRDSHFVHLCGDNTRAELSETLSEANNVLTLHKVYTTELLERKFDRIFGVVMCYSPRGVVAFAKANPHSLTRAFCIGQTTANEAKRYFNEVSIAKEPTTDSLTSAVAKYLRNVPT